MPIPRAAGGAIINGRLCGMLAVTRAFGDFALKKAGLTASPELKKVELRLTHKYLIAGSDGLWDFIELDKLHKNIK
jgi:serine/threonine protein phosphatase PrpC